MDNKELKIQGLLERISSLTTEYEDKIVNLRVELTIVSQQKHELESKVSELEQRVSSFEAEGSKKSSDTVRAN